MLRLKGVPYTITHQELVAAVEAFGTVRSAILLKASEEVLCIACIAFPFILLMGGTMSLQLSYFLLCLALNTTSATAKNLQMPEIVVHHSCLCDSLEIS